MPISSLSENDLWSDEFRTRAANNTYHSIDLLEKIESGWMPEPSETPEERKKLTAEMYNLNLAFLKNAVDNPYYEGFIDRKRVEDAIAAAEANPVSTLS